MIERIMWAIFDQDDRLIPGTISRSSSISVEIWCDRLTWRIWKNRGYRCRQVILKYWGREDGEL